MKRIAAISAPTLLLALTACGGSSSSSPSSAASSPSNSSESSSSSSASPRQLGQTLDAGSVTVTPSETKEVARAATHEVVAAGNKLVAIRNKTCLKEPGLLGVNRWKLIDTDGGEYGTFSMSGAVDGFPTPMYPQDSDDAPKRAAGDCVTGWIYFEVNENAKIKYAQYASGDDASHLVNNRWAVSK